MQKTHSTKENEIRWNDDFNGQIHYSHGKSNSCGVLIAFFGSITYTFREKASDKYGRILIMEALKYEIRCLTIKFSKDLAKAKKSKQYFFENQLKFLESNLNCDINCKNQLEEIYDDIAEGIKVRSKCQ